MLRILRTQLNVGNVGVGDRYAQPHSLESNVFQPNLDCVGRVDLVYSGLSNGRCSSRIRNRNGQILKSTADTRPSNGATNHCERRKKNNNNKNAGHEAELDAEQTKL